MSKPLQLHVPTPCHENWANMQPPEKGRHCAACQKTVVDFTAMSDTEIIRYMSKAGPHVCGRLAPDQVNRPLIPLTPPQQNRLPGWPLLLSGMLLTFDESATRHPVKQGKPEYEVPPKKSESHHVTVGMVFTSYKVQRADTTLKELVKKDSVPFTEPEPKLMGDIVTVRISDSIVKVGNDSTFIPGDTIPSKPVLSIADNPSSGLQGFVRKIACIRPGKINTLKQLLTDTLTALHLLPQKQIPTPQSQNNELTIYPNPVRRGITFRLAWQTEPGKYQVSLFSPSGALIQERIIDISNTRQISEWQLPTNGQPASISFGQSGQGSPEYTRGNW